MLAPLPPRPKAPQVPKEIKPFREQQPRLASVHPSPIHLRETRPAASTGSILVDSWLTIRRHWRNICLLAAIGLLAAVIFTLAQTPQYRAFALLEVRSLNGEFMDIKAVDPVSSGSADSAETDVQTQVKIIESQPVTIRTMQRMELYTKNRTSETQSYWSGMLSSLGFARPEPRPSITLLKDVEKSTRVRPVGPTRIIQITADSKDPFIAQMYVNTLADE